MIKIDTSSTVESIFYRGTEVLDNRKFMDSQSQTSIKNKTSIFRWIIFLPAAFLIVVIVNLLLGLILVAVGLQNQIFLNGITSFVGGFLLVFFAGIFAPSKRIKISKIIFGIVVLLAVFSFIFAIFGVEVFAERVMPDRLSIPVFQILGALYAVFLVPSFVIRGTTLEQFWREIIALSTIVIIFGGILSIVGLITGIFAQAWTTFFLGVIVLSLGVLTWLFPYFHSFFRIKKFKKSVPTDTP